MWTAAPSAPSIVWTVVSGQQRCRKRKGPKKVSQDEIETALERIRIGQIAKDVEAMRADLLDIRRKAENVNWIMNLIAAKLAFDFFGWIGPQISSSFYWVTELLRAYH
jgi:hypothetical protein